MVVAWRLLLVLLCVSCVRVASGTTNPIDADALKSLMSGWTNFPASWKQGTDPCDTSWDGIQCANGRVTSLRLPGLGIKGTLSGDVGSLSELIYLDLSSNKDLGGPLTANIGKLSHLTTLILQGCSFTGAIPDEIGNARNMTFLALNSNKFTGNIPASIGFLSNLDWLDLAENQLTGGLPISSGTSPGLDLLLKAEHFHFNKNQLSGRINATLFSSKMNLKHILFDSNSFTGSIPDTIGLVKTLEILRLDNNKFSGFVPTNITNLVRLQELNLANNQLSGPIPNLALLSIINVVDLSNNTFDSSTAPAWFTSLSSLSSLLMENLGLIGQIPTGLFRLPRLQQVMLDSNKFNGTLDMGSDIGPTLTSVNLDNNNISFAYISSSYTGSITLLNNPICQNATFANDVFCKVQKSNKQPYTTDITKCKGINCPNGQSISPRNCTCAYPFSGLMVFRAPLFVDLSDSAQFQQLESSLWTKLAIAPNSVYLSNIKSTGDKYMEVDIKLFPLSGLSFSSGDVIRFGFDLSNQTYKPPSSFGPYYFIQYPPFTASESGVKGKSLSIRAIAGIAVACCALLIALAFVAIYAFKLKRKAKEAEERANPFASWGSGGQDDGTAPQLKGARFFTFADIKKCTNNFSISNEIGSGGYGKVYKAYLPDGEIAAIKRAQQGSMQGAHEFKNEIELLSRVHHKNLVTLIGFCYEQGEQMLVYEYVSNGTLRENLVGKGGMYLDWRMRLEIALGSAKGLAYLHELADPPIIHRDIKSTNILLDEKLNAKVADFGLSKLMSDTEKGHVSTQVKGTLGYLDPEYYMTQQLSEKSDVYSFGVVLLELITASLPIEKGKYIVREMKEVIDQYDQEYYGLQDIMDPKIRNQAKGVALRKFVQLAMDCVQDAASGRPSMNEVVREIEIILRNEGFEKTRSRLRSVDIENTMGTGYSPYSDKDPMIRDVSSSAFDSSGGYPYQHIEPK